MIYDKSCACFICSFTFTNKKQNKQNQNQRKAKNIDIPHQFHSIYTIKNCCYQYIFT